MVTQLRKWQSPAQMLAHLTPEPHEKTWLTLHDTEARMTVCRSPGVGRHLLLKK